MYCPPRLQRSQPKRPSTSSSAEVVARFQAARGSDKVFTGAGRHGILTALPHHEVEERWQQIRRAFLDVKEQRGQNRQDANWALL